jgi:hypothetical protein
MLSTQPDANGEIRMMLPMGGYISGQPLEMDLMSKRYLITPAKIVEDGDGFDIGRFKVVRKL